MIILIIADVDSLSILFSFIAGYDPTSYLIIWRLFFPTIAATRNRRELTATQRNVSANMIWAEMVSGGKVLIVFIARIGDELQLNNTSLARMLSEFVA